MGQTESNNMTIKTPNPKMNPTIYRGKSRIQKGTKTEHYMQTMRFNQNNQKTFDIQVEQQNNAHRLVKKKN